MPANESKPIVKKQRLGFFTVIDHGPQGLYGGYLITNLVGRPLEFHCTAPLKPNRAQEILYGPTLEPYLYGEQIGQTLLAKAKAKPVLVCTDRRAALCVREFVDTPVALIIAASNQIENGAESQNINDDSQKRWRLDRAHAAENQLAEFHLGRNHLAVPERLDGERKAITERLADLSESFDLAEPFQRITEAIEEARRGGR